MKRTDEDLKKLAKNYVAGRVFTNYDCRDEEEVRRCFPILWIAGASGALKPWKRRPPAMIYEYIANRSPLAVSGKPIFFSCGWLNKQEFKKFRTYVDRVTAALNSV